jgi:ABC-2 type transport system permease protein
MSKLWKVAAYEYRRNVFKKSFIFALLSLPFFLALTIGIGALSAAMEENDAAVGYVDHSGLLSDPIPAPQREGSPNSPATDNRVPLVAFQTEEAAREALEAQEIQAYYVVAADYFRTNHVELVYIEPPSDDATAQFWDFMQINWLADLRPEIAHRAAAGSNLIVRWPDDAPGGGREFSQKTFLNNFLPLFAALAFIIMLFMSSGYLVGVVAEEKENRTVEILVTSISPGQLIGGKVLGIMAILFTQVVAWIGFTGLGIWIGGRYLGIGILQNLSLDIKLILPVVAIGLPAFVMVAALTTALGATVAETQEAQQATGLFALPLMSPFWLFGAIVNSPNGPLAIGLTLFPVTALSAISLRVAFSQVPSWQIGVSVAITSLCAFVALWLAGRAFRLGMLRYGQRLSWRELFKPGSAGPEQGAPKNDKRLV